MASETHTKKAKPNKKEHTFRIIKICVISPLFIGNFGYFYSFFYLKRW